MSGRTTQSSSIVFTEDRIINENIVRGVFLYFFIEENASEIVFITQIDLGVKRST